MAEVFNFELKLVDDVSRTAKKAADAVRSIESQSNRTKGALDFSKEIERSAAALKKIHLDPKGYKELLKIQKEIYEHKRQIKKNVGGESFGEGLNAKLGFGRLTSAAFLGEALAEGGLKIAEGLIEAAHKVVEIFTEGISKAFEESGKEETRRLNFKLSLGKKEGPEALEDIERFSKLTKFTPEQIAPMFLKLRRNKFDEKSARQVFATGADIEASGGMRAEDYVGFASKIKTKQGVTKKMLVEALGDVGDTIPDFFKSLGKKLGVSAKTAEKMAEEGGKVDPQLMLNMITASVNKRQGGAAGTGGKEESDTFTARWEKLKDLPNQFFKKMVDNPAFKQTSDAFGELLKKLDPGSPDGQKIMVSLNDMFSKIITWFSSITPDDIVTGVQSITDSLKKTVDVVSTLVDMLKKAAAVAEKVAAPLASAMDFGDKLLGRNQPGPNAGIDFNAIPSPEELQKKLRFAVTSGVVSQGDMGRIVNQWRQTHINSTSNTTVNGGDPEEVKAAVADGHREAVRHHERAAQER